MIFIRNVWGNTIRIMIVKITNESEEKYVLEQAKKEGFQVWGNIRNNKPFDYPVWFNWDGNFSFQQLSLWSLSHDPEDKTHTFEEFKQSRENIQESDLEIKGSNSLGSAKSDTFKNVNKTTVNVDEALKLIDENEKLQAENEELKDKLSEIENYLRTETEKYSPIFEWNKGYKEGLNRVFQQFFQTPTQKKALEIIEANEKEVIKEVVRVFKK